METKKSTISLPAASPEEIQEALPVPLDLDILPSPSHTDSGSPTIPAAPPGYDVPPGFNVEDPSSTVPIDAAPISFALEEQNKPGWVWKSKTPVSDETTATTKAKQVVRTLSKDLALLASSSNAVTQLRAHAEAILVTFDALRRRLEQISEEDGVQNQPDMKANDLRLSTYLDLLAPLSNDVAQSRARREAILATFNALRHRLEEISEADSVKINRPDMRATEIIKAKKLRLSTDLGLLASSSNAVTQPRAHAEAILATFDALRRRLEQISEAGSVKIIRPDMKAEDMMKKNDLMANGTKPVGALPGVEVGDIFYFRMEMCVVGLHSLPMAGIDCKKDGTNRIAIAIVSSGGYENKDDDDDVLVYTGHGGNGDQKLKGGNYAMIQSKNGKILIRVIRSRQDPFIQANKIYIYDGLYKIVKWGTEYSNSGFLNFKFRLVREQGQPEGFAVWKKTEKWKKEPSSRGGAVLTLNLSSGKESIPVIVVNEVDEEPEPNNFSYVITTALEPTHEQTRRAKDKVRAGCKCKRLCVPGDAGCYCKSENGGWLPYNSSGLLIKRLPMLYECGSGCECTINCQNRVTKRGIKLHFEVFRTENRGWGLRSWDPIRAGSFVCEFVGEHLENPYPDGKELVLNEYVFRATHPGKKAVKWNLGMELATKGKEKYYEPEPVPLPMISAKFVGNMSRFINHSCNPNLFWQLVRYRQWEGQYTHVMFFALKHIPPLTELTYDYNGDTEESMGRGVGAERCLCGAANCRGYFW